MPIVSRISRPKFVRVARSQLVWGHRWSGSRVLAVLVLVSTVSLGPVFGQETQSRLGKLLERSSTAAGESEKDDSAKADVANEPDSATNSPEVRSGGAFRLLHKDFAVRPASTEAAGPASQSEPKALPQADSLQYDAPVPTPPPPPELIELRPNGISSEGSSQEIIEGVPQALEPIPHEEALGTPGHNVTINPLGIQQGMANLAFDGDDPIPRREMGFPISVIPSHWGQHVPRLSMQFSLPQGRHRGKGEPLVGTSWLNRPLHVDLFSGGVFAGELVTGGARATNGMLTGTRIGWDLNHYVGGELRLAQGDTGIVDSTQRVDMRFYDVNILYYPWGDSRFRPFTTFGMGISQYTFVDEQQNPAEDTLLQMPFGLGFKYLVRPNLALRMEFLDNLAFGSSFMRTQNNLSLTGGFELRFGGRRRNYFPFTAASHIW